MSHSHMPRRNCTSFFEERFLVYEIKNILDYYQYVMNFYEDFCVKTYIMWYIFVLGWNSPTGSAVLLLVSWNYCSGKQGPTYPLDCTIFSILLNNLYNELKLKKKVLPHYVKLPLPHGSTLRIPFPLIPSSHLRQILKGRCWAVEPAVQNNSSNCSVLILHKQLRNYLLHTRKTVVWQPNISTWLYMNQCLTCINKLTTQSWFPTFGGGDRSWNVVSTWSRNSGPVTCLQDGHQGDTSHQCHRCCSTQRVPRHMCTLILITFLIPEIILAHTGMCCLLLLRTDIQNHPISSLLKGSVCHE